MKLHALNLLLFICSSQAFAEEKNCTAMPDFVMQTIKLCVDNPNYVPNCNEIVKNASEILKLCAELEVLSAGVEI